jgi:hypothetical protein
MTPEGTASLVTDEIAGFVRGSPLNRLPGTSEPYFDPPLVEYAAGDDLLFHEHKKIIHPTHLTLREALARGLNRTEE